MWKRTFDNIEEDCWKTLDSIEDEKLGKLLVDMLFLIKRANQWRQWRDELKQHEETINE